jgi:serine/threonine protein kinase/tetratricopeptide (TPR) repeat protein
MASKPAKGGPRVKDLVQNDEDVVDELFELALELSASEREDFFADLCQKDDSLLQSVVIDRVKSLLLGYDQAEEEDFLCRPLIQLSLDDVQANAFQPGQQLEHFRILRLLGEGGMGEVYLAEDAELERKVAIKVIKGNLKTKEVLRRFYSERQILANLQHPNIARLLEASATADGLPYFVMEYVEGQPIDIFADQHRLTVAQRLKLFRTICSAVNYAHQNLIIHRDIKPGNILVNSDGEPKLLDFGIAKLLQPTDAKQAEQAETMLQAMTPEYASPEQVNGGPITTATDTYSLGVLLYKLLTGHRPYKLKCITAEEMQSAIRGQEPERPSTAVSRIEEAPDGAEPITPVLIGEARGSDPTRLRRGLRGDLDNILLMALRKDPGRRYASAEQFSEDIRRYLDGLPVIARKDTLPYRTTKFVQRHKIGMAAASLVLLTLIGGIATTAWQARVAQRERTRAERRFNDVRELANSFMFEFHDSIKDVPGTLEARKLLVNRALKYLNGLAQEAGDDSSLQSELAVAYDRIGSITFDTEQALESHQKAVAINETLVKKDPMNAALRKHLALSYENVGDVLKQLGDTNGARSFNRKQLEVAESLASDFPADINYRTDLVDAYISVSYSLMQTRDSQGALDYLSRALGNQQSIVEAEPANLERISDLGGVYSFISNAYDYAGDSRTALEYARKEFTITEQLLASSPGNARYIRGQWATVLRQAKFLTKLGDPVGGLESGRRALALVERLAKADPEDKGHQHCLAITHVIVGQTQAALGQSAEALKSFNQGLAISNELIKADPNKDETNIDLAKAYAERGRLFTYSNQIDKALEDLGRACQLQEAASKRDTSNLRLKSDLADMYMWTGKAFLKRASQPAPGKQKHVDDWRSARSRHQKSLDLLNEMRNKGTMPAGDVDRINEDLREIARCDEVLK